MKNFNIKNIIISSLLLTNSISADEDIFNQSIENILDIKSELKANVGSRGGARNYLDANAPVDVITSKQIESSGLTSLVDVLRYFVAGFNAPETSIADGSEHVRAYTLRGMSPDQILVLVNGKRLHSSSLLHVNGTIGRGSSHADLDTIALKSIQRVEILRDGAAAQYGSDAISGVINIILKGMGNSNIASMTIGQRRAGDGTQVQVDTFVSTPLKYDGFVNLTLDVKDQQNTQRGGIDYRVAQPRVTTRVGIPDSKSYKAVLYTEMPQSEDILLYSNVLLNYRETQSNAFFRDTDNTNPIYKNGFLPLLNTKIIDYSASFGIKGEFSDSTTWEISNVLGHNKIDYYLNNSMNYSLGAASPTSFYNGGLSFLQNTTTIEIKKSDEKFKIAGGIEHRYEEYTIKAGDIASYSGSGSQGFAGYTTDNVVNRSRSNYAIYVDSIYNFSDKFMLEVALRYEEYSDFGESTNGKIAMSYKYTPKLMFRSSINTAFKAPSLAQSFYSQTSSYVNSDNVLSTQGTFRVGHEVSKSLGSQDLRAENSQHFTVGTVYKISKNSSFTLDYFYIRVHNKIMLSPELSADTAEQKSIFNKYGITKARYFANAAQTITQGIDLKLEHGEQLSVNSKLNLSLWINYNINKLEHQNHIIIHANNVDHSTQTIIEDGQPKDTIRFLTNYQYKKLSTSINISRYGAYKQSRNIKNYTFDAAWTTDLDFTYKFTKGFKLSIGGINVFNQLPNKWKNLAGNFYGTNGIKQYSRYSPFGYSGAYYYLKGTLSF